ncbi:MULTISPECIES: hypothetical protein [Bacteria]|uniref:hypothetical protein n=1 Tax=Bacteria TaxID=2 RepID=UPI003C7AE5EE
MRRDNPLDSQIPDILRRLRELETQSPLSSSSITRGQLRVASNEGLWVEGSLKVSGWSVITGTEKIDGRLWGLGVFDWEGEMNLSGAQNITGPATFKGAVRIEGQIDVIGPWKLLGNGEIVGEWKLVGNGQILGNVDVLGNGKLRVGNMVIDPTIGGGAIAFQNGGQVFSNGDTVQVYKGNSVMQIENDSARLQHGGYVIEINGTGVRISPGAVTPISGTGLRLGALYQDGSGYLRRADGS